MISTVWEDFKRRRDAGEDPARVLTELGVERYCCRRMLLSHKEIVDDLNPYQ